LIQAPAVAIYPPLWSYFRRRCISMCLSVCLSIYLSVCSYYSDLR